MPHPKRRTSKARKNKRRSHLALKPIQVNRDPRTGQARLPHRLLDTDTHYGLEKGGKGGFEVNPEEEPEQPVEEVLRTPGRWIAIRPRRPDPGRLNPCRPVLRAPSPTAGSRTAPPSSSA